MTVSADAVALLGRAGLDLLTLLTLVGWLYKGQQSVPSMPLIFTSLNIGIFAAVTAFTSTPGVLTAGLGFGLFAILQMIRLRSAAFTIKDVAFTFLVLITGLINALPNLDWPLLATLDIVILLAVAVTDTGRDAKVTRVMQLTLEKAYSDPVEVQEMLQERLGLAIESVVIKEIDFVRDTTDLKLSYFIDPAWASSNSEAMSESAEELYRP
jgi:signal transduction histidine kinase